MELTNIALAYQVHYLNQELQNGFINKIQRLENGFTKIKVHTKQGSKDLIIANNAPYITEYSFPAKINSTGFEAFIKKVLFNKRIKSINQPDYERTIEIEFEDYSLICEFFPESNMILLNKEKLIEAFKHQFKSIKRKIKKGLMLPEKEKIKLNPLNLNEKQIKELISKENPEKALIQEINLDPLIAKEAINSLLNKNNELNAKKLTENLVSLHEINEKNYFPTIINSKIYPFKLNSIKKEQIQINSINSVLDEFYKKELTENKEILKEKKLKEKELNKVEASIKQQIKAKEKFEKEINENKKKAELIYENYQEIEEIIKAVNSAVKKGLKEKEIISKFQEAEKKGNLTAKKIKGINLNKKEIEIEL
jgi:predicted ribosome quality control (RQC) complex YloA/Tae2 family protein